MDTVKLKAALDTTGIPSYFGLVPSDSLLPAIAFTHIDDDDPILLNGNFTNGAEYYRLILTDNSVLKVQKQVKLLVSKIHNSPFDGYQRIMVEKTSLLSDEDYSNRYRAHIDIICYL